MRIILYNGYVIDVEKNYMLDEVETVLSDSYKISELVDNLTDENLVEITYLGEPFYNLVCDNVMVLGANPSSEGYRVRIALHQKTQEELYAEAGRILLGEMNENTDS